MKYIQMNDYVTRFDGIMQSVRQEKYMNKEPDIVIDECIVDYFHHNRRIFGVLL